MLSPLKSAVRTGVHAALSQRERRLLAASSEPKWPHIFITGAPRAGTSLFYELMVTRYQLAFFSNLAHRFYKTPCAATQIGLPILERRKSTFKSNYGHISGWSAPNEGGWIWRRWIDDGPWIDESTLPMLPEHEIRGTLAAMSNVMEAPFVNKNVMHANRLRVLQALFPDCLIIEVKRDPIETIRSIVRARQRNKGPALNHDDWWSVQPSTAKGGTVVEQACSQVLGVEADIARDSGFNGSSNFLRVEYSSLCGDTWKELDRVEEFLVQHGVPAIIRADVPERFSRAPSKPLADHDEEVIKGFMNETRAVGSK